MCTYIFAEASDSKTKHALFALQNLYSTCSLSPNLGTSHPNIAKRGTELTHIHVCIFFNLYLGMTLGEEGLGLKLGEGGREAWV